MCLRIALLLRAVVFAFLLLYPQSIFASVTGTVTAPNGTLVANTMIDAVQMDRPNGVHLVWLGSQDGNPV